MIKNIQLILFVIFPLFSFAQKGFDISTGAGLSLPFSDIASVNDTNSGFAQRGYHFIAEGRLMFMNNFGIGFSGNFNEFKLNNEALYQRFYDTDNDSSLTIESGAWQFKTFTLSPVFSFPVNDKFNIFAKFSGTYTICNLPYLKQLVTNTGGIPYEIVRETTITRVFGYGAGIGLRYFLNDHLAVFAGSDFYYSQPDFKLSNTQNLKYQSAYLNINLGFTYKFVDIEEGENDEEEEDDKKQQTPFMW